LLSISSIIIKQEKPSGESEISQMAFHF